jgi:molybdenum cofactor cytidylyltransferase
VLAAGASSRLGRPKQLLELEGKPLLQHALDASTAAPLEEIVVVLGHAADEIRRAIQLEARVRIVVNPRFATGQSSSLVAGLHAAGRGSEAALIVLGDQPGVRVDAIEAVVHAWRRSRTPVLQASYRGLAAHPTLLGRSVWRELESATGDEGARGLIADHPDWRSLVEVGGEPPDDVDTMEDYRRIREAFGP